MDIHTLTEFFMWCTIINFGFLIFSTLAFLAAPNLIYRVQTHWIPITRQNFDLVFFSFIGIYKIFIVVFALVPWLALLILA